MTTVTLTQTEPAQLSVDVLAVPVTATPAGPVPIGRSLPNELIRRLAEQSRALGITGELDEVVRVPTGDGMRATVVALVGLGDVTEPDAEALRRAAGTVTRTVTGVGSIGLAFPADDVAQVAAVAEGALLGSYAFTRYRDLDAPARPVDRVEVVTPLAKDRAARHVVERAEVLARAVRATRDLVNMAPADLSPAVFADTARTAAKGTKVKVTVLDEKALADGGYGGLVAVGQGSTRPPRLVRLGYAPVRAKRSVALVGKGITFDSGGLSIKSAKGMENMKSDMAGAAAVLHTVLAAATLGLPVKVTGWLCLAENMPSGTAQRPSDVITQRNGTTVEVLNTDAEGRLVLADGLAAAIEEKPDVVVDIATLTGAQVVALGTRVSAVMGTDAVRDQVVDAAATSGESFWPMPLPGELRAGLKSPVADIANSGDRNGGMLTAGIFLREFTGDTPWAHLDIAGPSFNEGKPWGYTPAGGTGVGVRTLLALLEG
jgi:leucyl aminopeptidase